MHDGNACNKMSEIGLHGLQIVTAARYMYKKLTVYAVDLSEGGYSKRVKNVAMET